MPHNNSTADHAWSSGSCSRKSSCRASTLDPNTGALSTVANPQVDGALRQLYGYLVERGCIVQLENFDEAVLHIFSPDVLAKIQSGAPGWEWMVPDGVADVIKQRRLFGYTG